jgi:hypothetical protein
MKRRRPPPPPPIRANLPPMTATDESAFDPKRRRLCPDGTCVGLIGDDGRCKVCGAAADGAEPDAVDSGANTGAHPNEGGGGGEEDDVTLPRTLGDVARLDDGATFDPARRLCSDGSCLGVIGADNRCNVCGRPPE